MTGGDPDRARIDFTLRRLSNGLRVIVAPDHLVPVVAVNLWYTVGSRDERPGKTGFAHLFEHFMFQGSRHVAKAEHVSIVQGAGGVSNATTWFDRTNYFETLPSNQLELGLWLEADRMATLLDALDQVNLDNQREVVKNEKRQSYDNRPYGTFYERLMAAVFPEEHPYHHTPIGSEADLDAADLDDVRAFFATWYVPERAVLSIVGDVEPEEAFAAAERYFGPLPAGQPRPAPSWPELTPIMGTEVRETVPDAVPLVRIHWGLRIPPFGSPEFDALEVAVQIIAGGRGSRLYRSLVRERRLAQDVTLFTLPLVVGGSIMAGWATVRPEADPQEVERLYWAELERMGREPVSADELERARALIETQELAARGSVAEAADRLGMYASLFDDPDLINTALERYLAVDAARIQAACARIFRPDNRAVLTYVPQPEPAPLDGPPSPEDALEGAA
ncbi:MAG TPA: pitrilysin family protein [Candidatus Limnocylindrales bacterium]|nr:pitrilysin family protein [Candidatus Limnocylindrales bacterium]